MNLEVMVSLPSFSNREEPPCPSITFIVPAFNAEATISETLNSLVAQTRGDWEAIVIDDGSTDATAAIIKAANAKDARITLLRIANSGASNARNKGLEHARSEWICFLDADDWLAATYAEKMLAQAVESGADAVYCAYQRVSSTGEPGQSFFENGLEQLGFNQLARHCPAAIHSMMVRREAIAGAGRFDPSLKVCQDWDLWQKIGRRGAVFKGLPETLAYYRSSEGSLSSDYGRMLGEGLEVIRRGHHRDPRLSDPLAEHAEGAGPADLRLCETFFAVWCATAQIGSGGEGAAFIDFVQKPLEIACHEANLARTMTEGLATGAGIAPAEVALHLPLWGEPLRRLLASMVEGQSRARLAEGLTYHLERHALANLPPCRAAVLSRMAKIVIAPGPVRPIDLPAAVDRVIVEVIEGDTRLGEVEVPAFGGFNCAEIVALALRFVDPGKLGIFFEVRRDPRYWTRGVAKSVPRLARQLIAALGSRSAGAISPRATVQAAFHESLMTSTAADRPLRTAQHIAEVAASAQMSRTASSSAASKVSDPQAALDGTARSWEDVFAEADPWGYQSVYEQTKYRRTLDLLPQEPIGRALELACAEGHFTGMLAERVENLRAVDISSQAVARAAERCRDHTNISFGTLDVTSDGLPGKQDLITCSEFLYYLESEDELARIAAKLRDALALGGALVMANHFLLKDEMSATGFDWDQAYGGKVIHDVFHATPGLALEETLVTELYRIDRFRRIEVDEPVPETRVHEAELDPEIEPHLHRFIVWGGAKARRREVEHTPSWHVPVVMYHRIADDGPTALSDWRVSKQNFEAQLRMLRSHGFRSTTSEEILRHRRENIPLYGRPILITFDVGYQDFADAAWPLLRAYDFKAEVFLATDLVGQSATWDRTAGSPAPLMDWPVIKRLAAEGATFGSHLASHTPAPNLSSEGLLRETVRSRQAIVAHLGTTVEAAAAPYGEIDDRLATILAATGYGLCYSVDWGIADLRHDAFRLPRITVLGSATAFDLAQWLDLPA